MLLVWTREETILAMDFYVREGGLHGGSLPNKAGEKIAELSRLVIALGAYPEAVRPPTYRNISGANLKLMNLRSVDPTTDTKGMSRHSEMDQAVWDEFQEDLPRLHAEAEAIRNGIAAGTVAPARTYASTTPVPVERQMTEAYIVNPTACGRIQERREQTLVNRYKTSLEAKGVTVERFRYVPPGEVRPLFCDLWVPSRSLIIEAKATDKREALRMAIGQLLDYERFHDPRPKVRAVLLPYKPIGDHAAYVAACGVEAIWPHGRGFSSTSQHCI